MKFYLYEEFDFQINIKWDYDNFFLKRWYDAVYHFLLSHKNKTQNPDEADYFIITPTLKVMSFTGFDLKLLKNYILKLPYLNKGKHIVFDFSDYTIPLFNSLHNNIVHFKSAFCLNTYRPKLDINLPQFQRYFLNYDIPTIKNRKIIASFRGAPRLNSCKIRKELFKLNDNQKFIYLNSGEFEFEFLNNNMIVRKSKDKYSYLNLLYKSIFSICIKGCGTALSYRLIEILNAGSIPVIISDNYPLPFSSVINWDEICIVIKENNVNNINEILLEKSHNSIQLQKMQNKIKEIYLIYFSSFETMIQKSLDIFEKNQKNQINNL